MAVRLLPAVETLCKVLAALGLGCLIAFAVMTLINGITRSLFSSPIDLVGDAGPLAAAVSVASCFPMALWQKANIRITIVAAISPASDRVFSIFADLVVLAISAAMARQMFIHAADSASAGDSTAMLDIPTAPFWYYVAIMLAIATAVQAVVTLDGAWRSVASLPPRPASSGH